MGAEHAGTTGTISSGMVCGCLGIVRNPYSIQITLEHPSFITSIDLWPPAPVLRLRAGAEFNCPPEIPKPDCGTIWVLPAAARTPHSALLLQVLEATRHAQVVGDRWR